MTTKTVTRHRPFTPEFTEFFAGLPSWADVRSAFSSNVLRLEDEMKDGTYELRAEIPGIDPDKDVDISVRNGHLTIKAERSEHKETNGHSEFSYGSFVRSVSLPAGADEDKIKASYEKGILTVSVPVPGQSAPSAKHIAIESKSKN